MPVPKKRSSFEHHQAAAPAPVPPAAANDVPTSLFMASESMLDAGRTPTASADVHDLVEAAVDPAEHRLGRRQRPRHPEPGRGAERARC